MSENWNASVKRAGIDLNQTGSDDTLKRLIDSLYSLL